ncbi:GIY-YIG nuclease family protein [Listeria sp. FSL L7-1582]|uniref:GIY-YIG nuclease family protein n=1 Tax=Listeria portnoyi TaxID=2713504 RepID=UPI00164DD3D1|nr:GIY-YIG nuclease family protein [Listeria portnoyi]MBC6310495.1 GIY-YIG nuclease family protein [Listeria portnoyi]
MENTFRDLNRYITKLKGDIVDVSIVESNGGYKYEYEGSEKKTSGIYFIYFDSELMYIGKAGKGGVDKWRVTSRVGQHFQPSNKTTPVFPAASERNAKFECDILQGEENIEKITIEVLPINSKHDEYLISLEEAFIIKLKPSLNKYNIDKTSPSI